jgi:hypothetical protein
LRLYVETVGKIRDGLKAVKTPEELKALRDTVFESSPTGYGGRLTYTADAKAIMHLVSTGKRRYELPGAMDVTGYDLRNIARKLEKLPAWPAPQEQWQRMFDIRQVPIGSVTSKKLPDGTWEKTEVTEDTPPVWQVTKDYRILSEHSSQEAAEAWAKAAAVKSRKEDPKRPYNADVKRTGPDYRNGRDVTGDELLAEFGFRGAEFGLWTNYSDRQQSLNQAFDGLHDLARILNVPPKAISLNGELGIAFGARGSGKSAAHYEPSRIVINLTKTSGAGALAHEWAHAMDDYFGRMATKGRSGEYVSHGAKGTEDFRAELAATINEVMKAISERQWTQPEYIADLKERNATAQKKTDSWLKSVERSTDKVKLTPEQKDEVDTYTMQLRGQRMPEALVNGRPDMTQVATKMLTIIDSAAKAQKIRVDWPVTGGGKMSDLAAGLGRHSGMIFATNNDLARAEAGDMQVPNRTVPTNTLKASQEQGDYWQRKHELFARSFEAFIEDSIRREGNQSPYLVGFTADSGAWGNLYPQGDERAATNEAFQKMADTLKSRETDKGVALFATPTAPKVSIPDLHAAFVTAKRQQGDTPRVSAVYAAAKAKNPDLTRQKFMQAVQSSQYAPLVTIQDGKMTLAPITDAEIMDAADNATETPEAILEEWAATVDVVEESPKWKTVDGRTWLTEPEAKATGLVYYNIEPDEDGLNEQATEDEWRNLQRGKVYDIEAELLQASPTVRNEPFYSKLAQVIEQKLPNRADVATIKGLITNPQTGIKAEELKWSGILPWLEAQTGPITKQAVLDYLAADGALRLEEVRMDDSNAVSADEARQYFGIAKREWDAMTPESRADMVKDASERKKRVHTRYQQYQLPGGENYREVVLAMSVNLEGAAGLTVDAVARALGYDGWSAYLTPEQKEHVNREWAKQPYTPSTANGRPTIQPTNAPYKSSHFPDVPNYVAHMRLNDRTDAEGRAGTFIEEIQSDRHQAGREKGYREDKEAHFAKLIAQRDAAKKKRAEIIQAAEGRGLTYLQASILPEAIAADVEAIDAQKEVNEYSSGDVGVSDAPFRSTWPLQMFKRALADAVDAGKSWIGWTTGETQAERYDLSKQISSLHYDEASRSLVAYGVNGEQVMGKTVPPDELPDYIGKEAAKKLMEQRPNDDGDRTLRTEDLKVGGEGMKGFYDTILPKEIGKYVKQWGAGVVKGEIRDDASVNINDEAYDVRPQRDNLDLYEVIDNRRKPVRGGFATLSAAESFIATLARPTTPIWRVDITPQMRTNVDARQALFATPSGKEGDTGKKPRRTIDPATQGDTPTTESNRANPGDSPLNRRAAANARAKYEAEEMTQAKFDKLRSAVEKELERDFEGNLEDITYKLADIELNGGGLSIEDQEKVRQLANKLSYQGRLEGDRMMREQADRLFIANASIGSELGRGLALRRDQFKTPQERLDDAMGNILAPSQTIIRERTINVKTKKERDAIITEIIKENDAKVDAILKRNGLTQADLFLSVDDRFAMQEAILGLARVHLSQQSAAHKKAIEMSVRGYSDNAIAKETGLSVAEVSNTAQHFREVVAKQLIAKEVGKGNVFGKFIAWGKRIISEMDDALRATPSGKRRNLAEDLANTRAKKRNASAQEVAEAVQSILDTAIPTKSQRNSNWLHEATWTYGKKNQKVFVPYNPADWKQVYRVARELSTREATKLDKAYEYWINGILSGPQTHVVNTASNLLSTAWAYGPQWFAEATANVAIRNPNAPQFGEFRHVWAGFYKGIMPALRNFALAWDTEADPVEHQYLNKPVTVMFQGGNLDKVGGIRPSFGGTLGRYVRMPGRFLVAQDAFAKTLIMHAESAAMAYRLGKKQGLTKTVLENFIATQIATHGSESWQHAFEKAAELTFQDENDVTKAVEGVTNALKRAKFVGGLLRYLLPFVRTPTNIYRAGIRKAGGSAGMLLYRLGKSGYYAIKGDTNEFRSYREGAMVKDVSESVMATALWFIVMGMSEGDDDDNQKAIEITGSRPFGVANAGERASQLRQEGGSNLIIIRKNPLTGEKLDKPIQFAYGRYEPIALALSTLVDGAREFKEWTRFQPENRTTDKLAGSMMRHVLAQAKEKTFLQGVSGVLQFIEDAGSDNFSGKDLLLKNFMNGAIPNLIRQPYRLSQDEIADAKKAESELSRSLGIGQPKVNEAGQPVQRGGNAVTRVLFPVASKPSTELFDAALKKWNATNPDQQWNPDPLTKADLYVYGPKVDGKTQQVPLTDPRKITQFEQQIGQKFADYSARKLMAAGWRQGKPVTPQMIDAIKKIKTDSIKSVRASMGREERFGTTTPAQAPSTPPARPSPAPSTPVPSTPPRPVPIKDDAAERAKARLIEARKRLNYGSK